VEKNTDKRLVLRIYDMTLETGAWLRRIRLKLETRLGNGEKIVIEAGQNSMSLERALDGALKNAVVKLMKNLSLMSI